METEINIYPIFSFIFVLPDIDSPKIEVSVNYMRDNENHVNSEAWLHCSNHKATMFLADIYSFADNGQTEDEIEDRLLSYYNNSETFHESVKAVLNEQYDYFDIKEE